MDPLYGNMVIDTLAVDRWAVILVQRTVAWVTLALYSCLVPTVPCSLYQM